MVASASIGKLSTPGIRIAGQRNPLDGIVIRSYDLETLENKLKAEIVPNIKQTDQITEIRMSMACNNGTGTSVTGSLRLEGTQMSGLEPPECGGRNHVYKQSFCQFNNAKDVHPTISTS